MKLILNLHQGELSIVRLSPQTGLPAWLDPPPRLSLSRALKKNSPSSALPILSRRVTPGKARGASLKLRVQSTLPSPGS